MSLYEHFLLYQLERKLYKTYTHYVENSYLCFKRAAIYVAPIIAEVNFIYQWQLMNKVHRKERKDNDERKTELQSG